MLGFMRRTITPRNSELFSELYKSLVIPILEYCSQVWCPHLKKDLNILEKVQFRAFKCALGKFGCDVLQKTPHGLKWPTLQQRRLFSSLTECYKTINSLNGLDPSKFFTFARVCQPLKANHRFKLKSVSATLNSFNIFFIRIIDIWNNLPKEIADVANLNIFTSKLRRYLTSVSVGILNYVDMSSDMIFYSEYK